MPNVKNYVEKNITLINPLATNDDYSRHRNSAACYQLAQFVLKIGSALAERVGQGRWVGPLLWLTMHGGCCSWLYKRPGQRWMARSAFLYKRA